MFLRFSKRGLTLLELVLVMGMTTLLFVITHLILSQTIDTWWRVNSNQDADQQLYKARQSLDRDLRGAAFELQPDRATIGLATAPLIGGGLAGSDGDVLWFLSAVDPATGKFCRHPDGTPFWQRNILYYLVTPTNLSQHFDFAGLGFNADGYEVGCPYKLLIRKEIDADIATTPSDPSSVEKLLAWNDIQPYLSRPDGYDCANMTAESASIHQPVAANLLTFRAALRQDISAVSLDLRASAVDRARREGGFGSRDLSENPVTTRLQLVIRPPNRPPLQAE